MAMDSRLVIVPTVAGLPLWRASQELAFAGLHILDFREEPSDKVGRGFVIGTEPAAGTELALHSLVSIILSMGHAGSGRVPDVAGLTFPEAQNALAFEGYAAGKVLTESGFVKRGLVIRTQPPAGAELTPGVGHAVSVFVSTGPEPVEPPKGPPDFI